MYIKSVIYTVLYTAKTGLNKGIERCLCSYVYEFVVFCENIC